MFDVTFAHLEETAGGVRLQGMWWLRGNDQFGAALV